MVLTNQTDGELITNAREGQYAKIALVSLRIIMGWLFFFSGITKVLDPEWTATGYLMHAIPEENPFGSLWPILAEMPLIDISVQIGLTLVGLGIIFGAFTRWSAFWASVMMLFFWASSLPLENGLLIDEHIVYIAVLVTLSAVRAGRIAGLDPYLESTLTNGTLWLQYLMD